MTNEQIKDTLKKLGYDRTDIANYRYKRIPDRVRLEILIHNSPILKKSLEAMEAFGGKD